MSCRKTRNKRNYGLRSPDERKLFIIVSEGEKTEKNFFNYLAKMLKDYAIIKVIPAGGGPSPNKVLGTMKRYLADKKDLLKGNSEAWVIVDRDGWTEEQLRKCFEWSNSNKKYHFGLSFPKIEMWLLLHFEKPKGVTAKNVEKKLKNHIPNYEKDISFFTLQDKFKIESMQTAIKNAKSLDTPPCKDWPKKPGSTVYRLVENILNSAQITE